jgi:hypothetical protein
LSIGRVGCRRKTAHGGYRSNPQSNKELLLEMEDVFPPEVLVDSGLWKVDDKKPNNPAKPNPQYYGMSIREKRDAKGRKARDADDEVVKECVWDQPILIPYFNAEGDLVHLRPHKGMNRNCWCILVDKHVLGLVPATDAAFDESLKNPNAQGVFLPRTDWMDPQKGDLFALIESLESKHDVDGADTPADR